MTRVKRGTTASKRRKNVLKHTKGFKWGRKSKYKLAKDAMHHAWEYSFRDRKVKKRSMRSLWQTRISAACRESDITYSKFIFQLKKNKIELDRKILSQLAEKNPDIFKKIFEKVKN